MSTFRTFEQKGRAPLKYQPSVDESKNEKRKISLFFQNKIFSKKNNWRGKKKKDQEGELQLFVKA